MEMDISANGVKFIKSWEGRRLKMYPCAAGKLTIGYGHRVSADQVTAYSHGIDPATAEKLLMQDLKIVVDFLNKECANVTNQDYFDVLCSFVFNIGINAFRNSILLRDIKKGNLADVPNQLKRWIHDDNGNVIDGLKNRRNAESKVWTEATKQKKFGIF